MGKTTKTTPAKIDGTSGQSLPALMRTRDELVALCKERNIRGYSGKNKGELEQLLAQAPEPEPSPAPAPVNDRLKMVDLFSGTGAFTLAFESTGKVDVVFANDMVPPSKTIYDENFGSSHTLTLKNLHEVSVEEIPPHDILTGGFPCQPFSIAGRQEGFDDARSNVFWKILAIIDHHRPKCVILENVKNLLSHDEGRTFKVIQTNLTDRGYLLQYKVLNTAEITGIPQHRERIYIVCVLSPEVHASFNLDFPVVEKRPITEFLETGEIAPKYYYGPSSSTWALLEPSVVKQDTIYQYRRVYVRENKSNECPTLTANMGEGGHNVPIVKDRTGGIRKLTPRECFNFQGFPAEYRLPTGLADAKLYKLAGNAVSVPVVKLIAQRIVPLLLGEPVLALAHVQERKLEPAQVQE